MKYYKTQCNLHVKRENFVIGFTRLHYMGEIHLVLPCELKECKDCKLKLYNNFGIGFCKLEEIEKYDENKSVNKIIKDYRERYLKERKKIPYASTCPNIIRNYDRVKKRYDITLCESKNCMNPICAVTQKVRDLELVNIFYDIKHVEKRGFLVFEDWEKDLKYFDKRVPKDLAEKYITLIKKYEPEKINLRIEARKTKSLIDDLNKIKINRS